MIVNLYTEHNLLAKLENENFPLFSQNKMQTQIGMDRFIAPLTELRDILDDEQKIWCN